MENIYNVKELADKVLGSLRDNTSNMSTGFESVDRLTKGLQLGQLYIVGARPAMGKTAFVLNIIKHLILDEKKKVVLFSLGLHREKLMERLLAVTAQVGIKYNTDDYTDIEWQKLENAAKDIGDSKLIIDDSPQLSGDVILHELRKDKLRNTDIIFIDNVHLLQDDNRQELFVRLKAFAVKMNIPIVTTLDIESCVDNRSSHRPVLPDIIEYGNIAEIADVVMFLYRDEYYDADTDRRGIAEIRIEKNINGKTGVAELVYINEFARFADI